MSSLKERMQRTGCALTLVCRTQILSCKSKVRPDCIFLAAV